MLQARTFGTGALGFGSNIHLPSAYRGPYLETTSSFMPFPRYWQHGIMMTFMFRIQKDSTAPAHVRIQVVKINKKQIASHSLESYNYDVTAIQDPSWYTVLKEKHIICRADETTDAGAKHITYKLYLSTEAEITFGDGYKTPTSIADWNDQQWNNMPYVVVSAYDQATMSAGSLVTPGPPYYYPSPAIAFDCRMESIWRPAPSYAVAL